MSFEDHWKEWLGTIQVKDIEDSNFYVLKVRDSDNPQILDRENLELIEDLRLFYQALLIAVPYISHSKVTILSGADNYGNIEIRRKISISEAYSPIGCIGKTLNRKTIQVILEIVDSLVKLRVTNEYQNRRIWRILNAYTTGMQSKANENRLHQFVRCIEGFVLPRQGSSTRDMKHRTKLFLGHGFEDRIDRIYKLRSAIEHLHDPYKEIQEKDETEKRMVFGKDAYEAEIIARYCMKNVLLNNTILDYLQNDTMSEFWSLPEREREYIWGEKLNMNEVHADSQYNVARTQITGR